VPPALLLLKTLDVIGFELEVLERGAGRKILILHGFGARGKAPFLELLAPHGHIIAPMHPGFGSLPVPPWFNGVDDLAYIYLDLLDKLDWRDVTVIGISLGGWIACEMATKSTARMAKLILVDPIGIKVGDRETRDFPDIYALHPDAVAKLLFHDPANAPDYSTLSDEEMLPIARAREAGVLYLWEPYMHNPQLRRRLHRIDVPTLLVRGEHDGLTSDAYARTFAAAIPDATYQVIPNAGHSPQNEQADAFVGHVLRFLAN
jgi:pimeloyl-ACP methyl ester carboxylesterase